MIKVFTTLLVLLTAGFSCFAQDGTLDATFGNNGVTLLETITPNAEIYDLAKDDNGLMGAGFSTVDGLQYFSVVRLNLDGSLNTSFAENGLLTVSPGTGAGRATSLLQLPDGKYLAAGWARFINKDQYLIVRFMEDGTLDETFGEAGIATGSFSGSSFAEDEIEDMALLSDGKIVVAGRSYNGQNDDAFVACFNPDGSLFTNFGSSEGFSIIEFGQSPPSESATALVVDDADNIIIGGRVATDFFEEDAFFLTKVSSTGVVDNSFGTNGQVIYALAPNIIAGLQALAIDTEGRIITGGGAFNTDLLDNEFFLTRFFPNGTQDNSFGNNGEVIIPRIDNESISDLKALDSGDIIAAGSTGGFPSQFAIVRLAENGAQDLTFGNNGWATTQITSSFNSIRGIAIDDACIYAGGTSFDGDDWKMSLAKYTNQGTATSTQEASLINHKIRIYPNPVAEAFNLELALDHTAVVQINLVNLQGQSLNTLLQQQTLAAGNYSLPFNFPNALASGTYLIQLVVDGQITTQKVHH